MRLCSPIEWHGWVTIRKAWPHRHALTWKRSVVEPDRSLQNAMIRARCTIKKIYIFTHLRHRHVPESRWDAVSLRRDSATSSLLVTLVMLYFTATNPSWITGSRGLPGSHLQQLPPQRGGVQRSAVWALPARVLRVTLRQCLAHITCLAAACTPEQGATRGPAAVQEDTHRHSQRG